MRAQQTHILKLSIYLAFTIWAGWNSQTRTMINVLTWSSINGLNVISTGWSKTNNILNFLLTDFCVTRLPGGQFFAWIICCLDWESLYCRLPTRMARFRGLHLPNSDSDDDDEGDDDDDGDGVDDIDDY